ncbi:MULTISPECIES: DNA -binding domain-containing protein [unclassified Sphingobium]|uniref:DNA -binding domain-containing protein n=1 Tax=unclassified Sphingobium TaxID=2611147 RepID=UPI0035A6E92D
MAADPASSARAVDLVAFAPHVLDRDGVEHVRMMVGDLTFRLDVHRGSITTGPCALTFLVAHDARLPHQLVTVRRLSALLAGDAVPPEPGMIRFSRLAMALRAWDLRDVGTSLRRIADELCGPGDWPGPGEYRKSAARRHVKMGEALVARGPGALLASP